MIAGLTRGWSAASTSKESTELPTERTELMAYCSPTQRCRKWGKSWSNSTVLEPWYGRDSLRLPFVSKEIKSVILKRKPPWIFTIEGLMLSLIFLLSDAKSRLHAVIPEIWWRTIGIPDGWHWLTVTESGPVSEWQGLGVLPGPRADTSESTEQFHWLTAWISSASREQL